MRREKQLENSLDLYSDNHCVTHVGLLALNSRDGVLCSALRIDHNDTCMIIYGRPEIVLTRVQGGAARARKVVDRSTTACAERLLGRTLRKRGMESTATRLSALSRLFSAGVYRELAKRGRSPLFSRLLYQIGPGLSFGKSATVGDAFDSAFSMLRRSGQRNEYVYRSALVQNILLGRHTLNTTCMLTEFRAGSCKADVAILNGTSTVYEIKSDRDSLSRLANQIENYRKVFAKIYVIAGDGHVEEVIDSTSNDIGVLSLVRWDRISTVREAKDCASSISPLAVFESLRSDEARDILECLGVDVPNVPNTALRETLRARFANLHPEDVHRQMVTTLKRTRDLAPLACLIDGLPRSLQAAALSIKIRQSEHIRLAGAIRTPISEAMTWA